MTRGPNMKPADKLRAARHNVRHHEADMRKAMTAERQMIVKARYERSVALLVAAKLAGKMSVPNGSDPLPISIPNMMTCKKLRVCREGSSAGSAATSAAPGQPFSPGSGEGSGWTSQSRPWPGEI